MKRQVLMLILLMFSINIFSQTANHISIHQQETEYYNSLGFSGEYYQATNKPAMKAENKAMQSCNLNKIVFGWHPSWSNGLEVNYDWNLISDLSYFSYQVNPSTGEANTTSSWATANVVDEALANGKRVNLCVTLFEDHATFFGSSTSMNTLIDNLVSLVQSRGAHGVNIDFEGLGSTNKADFTNFMIALCNRFHTDIPGSQVSVALYAVDWSSVFDIPVLNNYVDLFVIMGYDYYYSGSTTAGPNDPLYHFYNDATTYNYTISKTVTSYLDRGVSPSKLILGLPYYGREYGTTSSSIPSAVNGAPNSASRTYVTIKNNVSGYYSPANYQFNTNSCNPVYVFHNGTEWRQCFFDNKYSMLKRFDFVNQRGIGGIGIWAMGYDDGYDEYWDAISEKFTDCAVVECTDTIYDMGGPNKDHYDDENYTYSIAPTGATGLTLTFTSFSLESGWDSLWIYDGIGTDNLIGGYSGTVSPGTIVSSTNALTLRFFSDGATVKPGFSAIWQCTIDNILPTTSIAANEWETSNFSTTFLDNDNVAVSERFYQVLDWNGTEWRANKGFGFFNDNFENEIHSEWTAESGTWVITDGHLNQTDQTVTHPNMYASVEQDSNYVYLYHWQMNINGTGTNRRAGMYIFASDPTATYRGEAYMLYFRVDDFALEIYRSELGTINLKESFQLTANANVWYDYKATFNPISGVLNVYQNNELVGTYTDATPYQSATAISLRTGNADVLYDDIKIYKSRSESELISIGDLSSEIRYQNENSATPSARIKSVIFDEAQNISEIASRNVNIDWTKPSISAIFDGTVADIDTSFDNTSYSAFWNSSYDENSDISEYIYAIGTSQGSNDLVDWASIGLDTIVSLLGLNLVFENTYYISVKSINGAGLESDISSSDGVLIKAPITVNFEADNNSPCTNELIHFSNLSINASSFLWTFEGGNLATSTDENPTVFYSNSGTYNVKLVAFGSNGSDSLLLDNYITVNQTPTASFMVNVNEGTKPLLVLFTNTSENANNYYWDFGNGTISTDINPYETYAYTGYFSVMLVVENSFCVDTLIRPNFIYVQDSTLTINTSNNDNSFVKAYPNPFTDEIQIMYFLDKKSFVKIEAYDVLGNLITSLVNNEQDEDLYTLSFNPEKYGYSEGVYLLNISFDDKLYEIKKLIKLK
ncbi:MAG TPA: hypothetical protein DDX39_03805 [Bacteroidales bacterium]|nr:MAG: hypothetical protein A2W98_08965 [Bacteroidetes bacterium GWF2_33_38]OFY90126.1 MAG: hypothetical protein A2236_10125 [Bacteroidetes bacterium RIFOXYA2_FULL_33_7]HBF87746.1 hypothetical protein [Bacteroidales bacterium]